MRIGSRREIIREARERSANSIHDLALETRVAARLGDGRARHLVRGALVEARRGLRAPALLDDGTSRFRSRRKPSFDENFIRPQAQRLADGVRCEAIVSRRR